VEKTKKEKEERNRKRCEDYGLKMPSGSMFEEVFS
jgi:hypothetical protein